MIISGALSIIGVVVGAFLNEYIHRKDFEKKVHGAELLIKSEIRTNVKNLNESI